MDHALSAAAADAALTTKLASLLPILDAFHYRHRNQHAASHWWSAFQLLRRGVGSLAADLRRHQALSWPQTDSGKKSTTNKTRSKTAQKQLLARVVLFRNHTAPKAYLCFSQLVADNQHAALGLLLLSALASINSILTSLSPAPQEPALPPSATRNLVPDTCLVDSTSKQQNQVSRDFKIDRGVAISRNHIPSVAQRPSKPSKPATSKNTAPENKDKKRPVPSLGKLDEKPNKKKSKKKGKDELSSLFGSL